jgi:hypothetical protein
MRRTDPVTTTQDIARNDGGKAHEMGQAARKIGEQAQQSLQEPLHQEPLQGAWEAMEKIPVGAYYFAMLGSITAALGFYLAGKKDTAQFIGQWAPTFALVGLMNKLLRPAQR